ncbi:MAG: biotin synthase BioB [Gammaproteobacteria bacterium]|nr:biotin synthase BioB [Gammaproteobacteria bacterium]
MLNTTIRHNWTKKEIRELTTLPFVNLLQQAINTLHENFPHNKIQVSGLFNIKSGNCSEDCAYCAQSRHFKTAVKPHKLQSLETVVQAATQAKARGIKRFCMGAAGRSPLAQDFAQILKIISAVKNLGLETCVTLGELNNEQVIALKNAGLDYYNHNINTSPEYYATIVTTHKYQDRLTTLELLRAAKINICCGGILGMGESKEDRAALLHELANFPQHPQSIPINYFIPIKGTKLAASAPIDPFEFVRIIAVARILMPKSMIRLAAGRNLMSDELQALCFCAGANSIFCGEKLLTAKNPPLENDLSLLQRLGLTT